MIESGEITDAKTIIGLLFAAGFRPGTAVGRPSVLI